MNASQGIFLVLKMIVLKIMVLKIMVLKMMVSMKPINRWIPILDDRACG